jgi:hypothetical protein
VAQDEQLGREVAVKLLSDVLAPTIAICAISSARRVWLPGRAILASSACAA